MATETRPPPPPQSPLQEETNPAVENITGHLEAEHAWWTQTAETLTWTYAKTMPHAPHEYVVRNKTCPDDQFLRAVKLIRTLGKPRQYYGRTNIYLDTDDYRYWTMGDTLENTRIINRATHERTYGPQKQITTESDTKTVYDLLAPDYDDRYSNPDCEAENRAVVGHVLEHHPTRPRHVLDLGAGTGLSLDLGLATPENITALDPSQAMLNELLRKHPAVTSIIPAPYTADTTIDGTFDLVLSLFGAASYLEPDALKQIPSLLTPEGTAILMFYKPGYYPDYYPTEPATSRPALTTGLALGPSTPLTNYIIVTVKK